MMVLICSALYLPLIQVNFCLPSDAIVSYSTPTAPLMFYEIFKMKQEGNKYIKLSMIQLQGFFFCTKKIKKNNRDVTLTVSFRRRYIKKFKT